MTPQPNPATVSSAPAQSATPPAAAAPAAPVVDTAALEKQISDLKAENAEKDRAAQFWYGKANAKGEAPAEKKAADPEVDMLALITEGGSKAFDKYMKDRGFTSREEVDALVNSKAQQLSAESELMSDYPDLKKQDSPFFKATAAHYGQLKKEGVPEAVAMRLAARQAELDGIKSGTVKTPQQQTDEKKAQKEQDRLARIAAQAGDKGGRASEAEDDGDDELTADQKHICKQMGISEEAYIARVKSGKTQMWNGKK